MKVRGNALRVDVLRKIDDLSRFAETIPGVGETFSFADLHKRFNFVMNNDDPAFKTLPDSDQTIIAYTQSFGGDDAIHYLLNLKKEIMSLRNDDLR